MPGVAEVLSPQQVRAVITFVRLLSPGYELYDRFCVICHGPDGHPPVMSQDVFGFTRVLEGVPAFDQEYFRTHTPNQVRAGIQHMLKTHRTAMPHFAGALNADEARQIVTYLRTLTLAPSQK
jgi:mono/diheme cytochrome c family protein